MPLKQAALRPPQNDTARIASLHGPPAVVICGRFRLEIGSKNPVFLGKGRFETLRLQIHCKK